MGLHFCYEKDFNNFALVMPKELYLYSQIYDFVAESLIAQMEEYQGEDITIRSCSPGGSVFAGWGIIAKMQEHEGKLKIKADGLVASMALYMLLFCDDVECLDVTSFVLHRADMYVGDPDDQAFLDGINEKLKEKLTAKIDSKKLKELKGVTIKDIFNPEGTRQDVRLTASEAKQIGLVKTVKKITPAIKAEFEALNLKFNVAATIQPEPLNKPTMTIEEIQKNHPAVYAQILALGVKSEKERVEACLVFNDIDPVAVKAAIESGAPLSQKQIAEFGLKAINKNTLTAVKKDAEGNIITEEPTAATVEATKKEAAIAEFSKAVDANLNLKTVK